MFLDHGVLHDVTRLADESRYGAFCEVHTSSLGSCQEANLFTPNAYQRQMQPLQQLFVSGTGGRREFAFFQYNGKHSLNLRVYMWLHCRLVTSLTSFLKSRTEK